MYFYNANFSATYFLMPFRFWEIGFGSISYLITKNYLLGNFLEKKSFLSIYKLKLFVNDFLFIGLIIILFLPNNYGNFYIYWCNFLKFIEIIYFKNGFPPRSNFKTFITNRKLSSLYLLVGNNCFNELNVD